MDPEPCSACRSCVETDNDVLMGDVMEIDAASQNSVQSVKHLIGQIQYAPIHGRKKIVIIDECHMLSNAASNALLKTLEEPPEHVLFIFCTTDPQKVLDTIRSRCMYFEFQRLSTNDVSSRLIHVAKNEGIELDPAAAELVGSAVNGALRDAITILDQASIVSNKVDSDLIAKIIGHVPVSDLYNLFSAVFNDNHEEVQKWVATMNNKLDQDVIVSTLSFIETLVLLNVGSDVNRRVPPDLADKVKKLSQVFTIQQMFTMAEVVKSTLMEYRRLSLRDSKVLLRLMGAGLILAKQDRHNGAKEIKRSVFDLAANGSALTLDIAATIRRLFDAEQVDLVKQPQAQEKTA